MDKDNGLPSLPDKSFDLCITDPPYNIGWKNFRGISYKRKQKVVHYKDLYDNYQEWVFGIFDELKRVCHKIIFTPGYNNLRMWYQKEAFQMVIWYNKTRRGQSRIAGFNTFEALLVWSDTYPIKPKFSSSVKELLYSHGTFHPEEGNLVHSSPKPIRLYQWIIEGLKPKSVIDPFLGSGTTAQVCTKKGIKWLGYEVEMGYSVDIEKRLKNCYIEPKQTFL